MAQASYRFGPFLVDGVAYRVWRGRDALDLTPQLLDLLVYLLERAGTLVMKGALLAALWPDANVTENAVAQAVSELRRAIGDNVRTPRYIKTIARRGYRFIGAVERVEVPSHRDPEHAHSPVMTETDPRTVAVLDFENMSGDVECAWLATGIADAVTSDLRALAHFHVVDRSRVADVTGRANRGHQEVAVALQALLLVFSDQLTNRVSY